MRRARLQRRPGILRAGELQNALRTQVTAALAQLEGKKPSDTKTHSARKWIKKARASARLMRYVLGEANYRRENAALRDAAQQLSAARDLKVLIEALDALVDGGAHPAGSAADLRRVLIAERNQLNTRIDSTQRLAASRNKLRWVRRQALKSSTAGDEPALILHALRRTYRRGRRAMAAARKPSAANLHEWRKEIQYLWHQLELLESLAPRNVGTLVRRLQKLSKLLGEDHDLAMLSEKVRKQAAADGGPEPRALLHRIEQRRQSLQSKAFSLGRRSYKKRPSRFISCFAATRSLSD